MSGVAKSSMDANADGNWYGQQGWKDENVKAELSAMKSSHVKTVRNFIAINSWKFDLKDSQSSISGRTAILRLSQFTAELGLNLIICPVTVVSGAVTGEVTVNDPLPYPNYAKSKGASSVIASKADFVEFWRSVAAELKNYNNVLFELWNEPQLWNQDMQTEWLDVCQQCITAIRSTDSQNTILVPGTNWGRSIVNLDTGVVTDGLQWALNRTFIGGNVGVAVHLYGGDNDLENAHIQRGGRVATSKVDINKALELMGYDAVAKKCPLYVTEIAPNMDVNTVNELLFFKNTLERFVELGIKFTAWGWWHVTTYRLLKSEAPSYELNEAGIILLTYLSKLSGGDYLENKTFSGAVSHQVQAGEKVTVTITKPDGSKDVLSALTKADRSFSVSKELPAGTYTVVFSIEADVEYEADVFPDSGVMTFVVAKSSRVLSGAVS